VTTREEGYVGPIDWTYDFKSHGWGQKGSVNPDCIDRQIEWLKKLDATSNNQWSASTYTGWPRIWHKVISVGMYIGWPYWRPIPSVLLQGPLGPEWHSFLSLTGVSDGKTSFTG
jgi:hypothetical protein